MITYKTKVIRDFGGYIIPHILSYKSEKEFVKAKKAAIKVKMSADELAEPTLWTCTKAGADVTITGVVKNDTLGGWDVSHSGSGAHVYGLVSPALLAAADVGGAPDNGYEAGTVTITVPAS